MRKIFTVLAGGLLAMVLAGCGAKPGTSDPVGLLRDAFPAVVDAAAGDPEVSLAIQVISADEASAVSPTDLGYSGTGSLTSYRTFLGK